MPDCIPLIVLVVAAELIPVSVIVDPLVGTAIAVYEVTIPVGGGVNPNVMEDVVLEIPVRSVGVVSMVP